ncbi:hypothetical protein JYK05_20715 (plasmid) [Caballeronia sp. M1242]|nr:hypothetical protein JYK05_20715 [Caballeronia sp. M1242]
MKRYLVGLICLMCATASLGDDASHHGRRRPVRVFDANGALVGDLTVFNTQDGVAFTVGDAVTVVPIRRVQDSSHRFSATDFQWATAGGARYASADCSGDPIVDYTSGPRSSIPVRRGTEAVVYIAVAGPMQLLTVRSSSNADLGTCAAFASPQQTLGYPVAAQIVVTRGHPEPLHIGY